MSNIKIGNVELSVVERINLSIYHIDLLTKEERSEYEGKSTEQFKNYIKSKSEYEFQRLKVLCPDARMDHWANNNFVVVIELTPDEAAKVKKEYKLIMYS